MWKTHFEISKNIGSLLYQMVVFTIRMTSAFIVMMVSFNVHGLQSRQSPFPV